MKHSELSEELKTMCGCSFGLSGRSIRRLCERKNIHKASRLSEEDVNQSVAGAIDSVMGHARLKYFTFFYMASNKAY